MTTPVTAEVFITINGKRSDVLARTTLMNPATSDADLACLLRELANGIEAQTSNPYPEAPDALIDEDR